MTMKRERVELDNKMVHGLCATLHGVINGYLREQPVHMQCLYSYAALKLLTDSIKEHIETSIDGKIHGLFQVVDGDKISAAGKTDGMKRVDR